MSLTRTTTNLMRRRLMAAFACGLMTIAAPLASVALAIVV